MKSSYLIIHRRTVSTDIYDDLNGQYYDFVYTISNDGVEHGRMDTSGHFGFGTVTPSARVEIKPVSVSESALAVRAIAGQTEDIAKFFDANGTANTRIDKNGKLAGDGSGLTGVCFTTGIVPPNSAAPGRAGQIEFDSQYVYLFTSDPILGNGWKRAAISVF